MTSDLYGARPFQRQRVRSEGPRKETPQPETRAPLSGGTGARARCVLHPQLCPLGADTCCPHASRAQGTLTALNNPRPPHKEEPEPLVKFFSPLYGEKNVYINRMYGKCFRKTNIFEG